MVMIRAVAFDFEGPLVNIELVHHRAHILAAEDAGLQLSTEGAIRKIPHFIGGPDEAVAREIAEFARGVFPEFILERKRYHYARLLKSFPVKLRPGVSLVLEWLQKNEFKVMVGSLTAADQAEFLLAKTGLDLIIGKENIVLREDVENVKPAPDVWLETARRAGVDPAEQLVFEDSPNGLIGVRDAGSIGVGVLTLYNDPTISIRMLREGAVRIIRDWRELNISALIENLNNKL